MAGAPRREPGRQASAAGTVPRSALRHSWSTLAVSAALRPHDVRPYPRGLSVQPRADRHETPEDAA